MIFQLEENLDNGKNMTPGSHSSHGTHRGSYSSHGTHRGSLSSHGTHQGSHSSHGTRWVVVSTSVLSASVIISLAVMNLCRQMTVISYSCSGILEVMFFTWNPSGVMFLRGDHRGSLSSHGTHQGSHSSHGTHRGSHSSHDTIWGHILPMIRIFLLY